MKLQIRSGIKKLQIRIQKTKTTVSAETKEYKTLEQFAKAELMNNGYTRKELKLLRKKSNAQVVVEETKKRVFRNVPEKFIPKESFEQEYNGTWQHLLGYDLEGKLWPLEPNEPEENMMPTDLYMALHCTSEVNEFYGLSMPLSEKVKLGIFVGLIITIVIVVFFLVTTVSG